MYDEYKDIFGDAPETMNYDTSYMATESAFNFDAAHGFDNMDIQNSPAKRLINEEFDFDSDEEDFKDSKAIEFDPQASQDPLAEGCSGLKDRKKKKRRQPDKLDEIISKLQIMVVAYGFPDPGNIRSKSNKEIKKTIKCFSAMLQQRENDMRFRKTVNEKFRKVELELDSEMRKNKQLIDKKTKLDREVAKCVSEKIQSDSKTKEDGSKSKIESQNTKKLVIDLKLKLEVMSKELKRKETQMDKIKEQMRNIIDKKVGFGRNVDDFDYKKYENSLDLTSKILAEKDENNSGFYKYIPERELMELQKKGFDDNHTELIYENEMLRACIVRLQSELNNFMAYTIDRIREFDVDTKILDHLSFDKFKMIKFKPMQLELPQSINGDRIKRICVENIERFKDFLSAYLNPADVYCILAKLNKELEYDNQILTFDDLSYVIKQWKNIKIK